MESIKQYIKSSKKLKSIAHWALMPKGQARPRLWVKMLVNPFFHKKAPGSHIRCRTRIDVFPYSEFTLGKGSTIEDFCTVNNAVGKIRIGNNSRVGIGSVLIGPVIIGDEVRLAQNVVISALNHNYTDIAQPISKQGVTTQTVFIDDETWIGANAVILPDVFIGKHCIVAAGSVVTKNVPSYSVVAGNPAKLIKQYNKNTGMWERVN